MSKTATAVWLVVAGALWAGAGRASAAGQAGAGAAAGGAAGRPNVVFILADDLGWRDVGCFGSLFHKTPHIDRLAARGIRLTQAYAASPLCSPTRSSILTGLYPARIGITAPVCHVQAVLLEKRLAAAGQPGVKVLNAESLTRLKPEYFTLAEALKEAGYATAHFGKWHLGHNLAKNPDDRFEPRDQGFELDFPHTPAAAGPGGGYLAPWKFVKDPAVAGKPGEHIEDRMSAEAAAFIKAHKGRPFFVNYWAYSVHSPWNARQDYIDEFKKAADEKKPQRNPLYAGMVKSLDDGVGRLLAAIDEAGIADRTIVVFFSDNGGFAYPPKNSDPKGYETIPATSNLPLRSGKASLYEGGTREPCIVAWPGKIAPGTSSDALFQSVDWHPTLLAMCGVKVREGAKLDGVDQSGMLAGGPAVRDRVFCHFPHGGARQAEGIPGFLPGTYVRKGDWKLIRFFADNADGSDRLELYNLKDDVGETKNLAAERPEIAKELDELISGFLKETEAVVPARNPAYAGAQAGAAAGGAAGDPLQGWKARSCDAAVKDGIVTVTGKGAGGAPFLGVGAGVSGPVTVVVRARCADGGDGKIEWLPPAKGAGAGGTKPGAAKPGAAAEATSVPFALKGGDWQEVTVEAPGKGPVGILRVYLPAQNQPVEVDRIEIKAAGGKGRKWEF